MNALEHVAGTLALAVEFDEIDPNEVKEYLRDLVAAATEFGEEVNSEKMQRLSTRLGKQFGHLAHLAPQGDV